MNPIIIDLPMPEVTLPRLMGTADRAGTITLECVLGKFAVPIVKGDTADTVAARMESALAALPKEPT